MNISPVGYNLYSNTAFGKKAKAPKMTHKEKKEARREERVSNPHYKPHRIIKAYAFITAALAVMAAGQLKVMPPSQNPVYQNIANTFRSEEISKFADDSSLLKEAGDRFFDVETSFDTQAMKVGFEASYYYNNGLNIGNISDGHITVSEENPDELLIEFKDSQKTGTTRYSMNITKNDNVDREVVFKNLDNENEVYTYSEFMGKTSLKDKNGKEVENDNELGRNTRKAAGIGMTYVIPLIVCLGAVRQLSEGAKDHRARKRLTASASTDDGGEE